MQSPERDGGQEPQKAPICSPRKVKFRNAILIVAGILFLAGFISVGVVADSQPRTFKFLENQSPKKVVLQSQPLSAGMDVRYYVIHKPYSTELQAAESELLQNGWKDTPFPGTFRRGRHGLVQLTAPSSSSHPSLTMGLKATQYSEYTIVKVVDPRFRTVLKDRIANWANGDGQQT